MFLEHLNQIPQNSRLALYGCGGLSDFFEEIISRYRHDITIICYMDTFNSGVKNSLPIVKIDNIDTTALCYDHIIVTSIYWQEISQTLIEKEIKNFSVFNPDTLKFIYTKQEEEIYKDKLSQMRELLFSKEDKHLFDTLIQARTQQSGSFFIIKNEIEPINHSTSKYLDYLNKDIIVTAIEGGVHRGKYTKKFIKAFPNLTKLYGFDPFIDIYSTSPHRSCLSCDKRFHLLPFALFDTEQDLPLHISDNMASIDLHDNNQNTSHQVRAISIDHFMLSNNIASLDYIKFDIEASELHALKGGEKTLIRSRPQMAVCIYHTKTHLFEIALYLNSILKDYIFRIGHYSDNFGETVLYAIPEEKYSAPKHTN